MRLERVYFVFLSVIVVSFFTTMMYMANVSVKKSITLDTQVVPVDARECDCHTNRPTTSESPSYTRHLSSDNASEYMWKLKWNHQMQVNKICKIFPNNLIGRFNITKNIRAAEVTNVVVNSRVKYGGVYRPLDCQSDQKVAVIIPYRDREEHLNITVNLLHNILQRQKLQYGIYVVEMALPVQFNRGLLANAGFLTASSIGQYNCYIIHDVDLIPLNDRNIYKCGYLPRHLSASNTKYSQGLPYSEYVGGVLALSYDQYTKLNGFSNLYFGWGGEDDDMYKRIEACNMTIDRPEGHIGTYLALPHTNDISNPPNPYRNFLIGQSKGRKDIDGLSSIIFHRRAVEFRPLFTWILIKCVESEIMENYAHLYVKQDKQKPIQLRKNFENRTVLIKKGKLEPKANPAKNIQHLKNFEKQAVLIKKGEIEPKANPPKNVQQLKNFEKQTVLIQKGEKEPKADKELHSYRKTNK